MGTSRKATPTQDRPSPFFGMIDIKENTLKLEEGNEKRARRLIAVVTRSNTNSSGVKPMST